MLFSIEGALNTYLRVGKVGARQPPLREPLPLTLTEPEPKLDPKPLRPQLFPGPHLFAGAGITVLWAL